MINETEIPIKLNYDWKLEDKYQQALKDVKLHLKEFPKIFTVAQLVRVFPKYERIILDILDSLRYDKDVDFVDWKPFPTKVERT